MSYSHRNQFSRAEITKIQQLLRDIRASDRDRQKVLRSQLRRMGFYITDYATDQAGFSPSDVDRLISKGVIKLADSPSSGPAPKDTQSRGRVSPKSLDQASELGTAKSPGSGMTDYVADALSRLSSTQARVLHEQIRHVPTQPGLYAIYGDEVWEELGLGAAPDDRPLYVGKAEDSLATRDIKTHFGDGRTGQSTVRRSFAALLAQRLDLHGMPRNPGKPAHFSNYGLSPSDDRKLTDWMKEHLRLAVWPKPTSLDVTLIDIERAVLVRLQPPLNLKDVVTPWAPMIKEARKALADEARAWKG
jgi:hypothetical protein